MHTETFEVQEVSQTNRAPLPPQSRYAFDLPGFGDSEPPTRNRVSAYAEDVQAALAVLEVHDFTLVGHSLGGAVGTGWRSSLGDDVAALVLIAPAGFGLGVTRCSSSGPW